MRLAPPVTSITKRSLAVAAPADSRRLGAGRPAQLLVIELDADRPPPDDPQPDRDAGRPLEPGVVRPTDRPDRDDAGRPPSVSRS